MMIIESDGIDVKKNDATPEIFFKKTLDDKIIIEGFKYFIGDAEFKSVYGEEVHRLFYSDLPNFSYANDGILKLHRDNLERENIRFYPGQFLTMGEFAHCLVTLKKCKERLESIIEKVKEYKIERVRIGDLMKNLPTIGFPVE